MTMDEERKNNKWLRLAAPITLVTALVVLVVSGALDGIDSIQIKNWIVASGLWGPCVFILLLAVLQPFYVSVYLFLLAAVAIWGPWIALPICWLGIQGACLWPYLITRHLISVDGAPSNRVPERARPYLERINERGLSAVIVTRLVFYTATPIQWCYGLTPVKPRDFVLGTGLGTIPMTVLTLFVGEAGISWWRAL
jgi:uncharacterized membrane protein YdjX (TVP38/TMEM64 family)